MSVPSYQVAVGDVQSSSRTPAFEFVSGLAVVIDHSLGELLHFVVRCALRRDMTVLDLGHSVHP